MSDQFDVGYVQGTKVVRLRSRIDIQEFWKNYKKGNLILWCDGLSKGTSKSKESNETAVAEPSKKNGYKLQKMKCRK